MDTATVGDRNDVTPLFADAESFNALVHDLVDALDGHIPTKVACVDALGFILGTAIARELDLGVIAIRKGGKLPVPTISESFIDYSGSEKVLELRRDLELPGEQILIIDEWIETGAQIMASIRLIEACGATVSGVMTIHMDENQSTLRLAESYTVITATGLNHR
jgi:adenine phosphoribosyltransferase